jgi:hypothetical protein
MSASTDPLRRWTFRLRIAAYVCGFAGTGFLLAARSLEEPGRTTAGQVSFLLLAVMFGTFLCSYVLAVVRGFRR